MFVLLSSRHIEWALKHCNGLQLSTLTSNVLVKGADDFSIVDQLEMLVSDE